MASSIRTEAGMPLRSATAPSKPKTASSDTTTASGQKQNVVPAPLQGKDVVRKKPLATKRKTSTVPKAPITSAVNAGGPLSRPEASAPAAKVPTEGPLDVKKVKTYSVTQPFLEDLRKASTSSTASTVSSASLASTATSYSTASVKSTATIKPSMTVKAKAAPESVAVADTQEGQQQRKVSTTVKKPIVKKKTTLPSSIDVSRPPTAMATIDEKPDVPKKKPLKKKQPVKEPKLEETKMSQPEPRASLKETKPSSSDSSAPPMDVGMKPAVAKPKVVKRLAVPVNTDTTNTSETSSVQGAKRTKAKAQVSALDKQITEPLKAPAKKSKAVTSEGTVKKVKASSAAAKASGVANAASQTTAAPKPAATKGTAKAKAQVPTNSSTTTTTTKTAPKRTISAPLAIPPTPKSARKVKPLPRASTPPPVIARRPQTERPLTRRKSVSFGSPLEMFQIIPSRRSSTPPPTSSRKKWNTTPSKKADVPAVPKEESEESVEKANPPPPASVDEEDHFVFQDEEDVFDRLALGLPVAIDTEETVLPEEVPSEEVLPEEEEEEDAAESAEDPPVDDVRETAAPPNEEASESQDPPPEAVEEPVSEPAFETEPETQQEPDEDDESTIFYDVDESYIPQYSSPRKPGTPRTRLASTPGSARAQMAKMGKSPKLEDSPKLDLLRLNSPTKKKKKKVAAAVVGDEARMGMDGGAMSPLAAKLETAVF